MEIKFPGINSKAFICDLLPDVELGIHAGLNEAGGGGVARVAEARFAFISFSMELKEAA